MKFAYFLLLFYINLLIYCYRNCTLAYMTTIIDSPGVPASAKAHELFRGFSYVAPMILHHSQDNKVPNVLKINTVSNVCHSVFISNIFVNNSNILNIIIFIFYTVINVIDLNSFFIYNFYLVARS